MSRLDAALMGNKGFAYFFVGARYYRYSKVADRTDPAGARPIADHWPGLWAADVDAAVSWGNGKAYFFRGSEYLRYDMASDRADEGYPLPIAGHWPGLWDQGIDAAVSWGNGKAYFFRGSEYLRYDMASDRADEGYPLPIAGHWPGLWDQGIDAAVSWGNGKAYFFRGSEYLRYDLAADRADAGYPLPIASHWPGLDISGPSVPSGGHGRESSLDGWLDVPLGGRTSATSSSTVTVHTASGDALAAFGAAVARCTSARSLILISGWDFSPSTLLTATTSVGTALGDAAAHGAQVRALFNHFPVVNAGPFGTVGAGLGDNAGAVAFINGLPGGAAIHDDWLLRRDLTVTGASLVNPVQTGTRHQKAWAVWDGERLTAWCGGVDLNPNRSPHQGSPLHDVQAELSGTAAADLYQVVREQWNHHPSRPPAVTVPPASVDLTAPPGPHRTRILTTYGNPSAHAGLGGPPYPFAPSGSTAIRDFLVHAIGRAERFIYLEDQYLVDEETATHLAGAMGRLKALIIVICATDLVNDELRQAWARRARFLGHLTAHSAKVAVVTSHRFVHAKTWVFDDEVALVSSANLNRRGMTHDSEVGVAFGDLSGPGEVQRMRQRLWQLHLDTAAPPSTTPPEAALGIWKAPPPGAKVSIYVPGAKSDATPVDPRAAVLFTPDQFWDELVDPGV